MRIVISMMIAAVALAGCTTYQQGIEREGRSYIEEYPGHKSALKQAIKEKRVISGMTMDEVIAAKGEPVLRGESEIGRYIYEKWVYEKKYNGRVTGSSILFFHSGILSFWSD